MTASTVLQLVGLGIVLFGIESGVAADDAKKIPLASVYTTTRQKDTKDARAELKDVPVPIDVPQPIFGERIGGKPAIFLVNGKDFPAAVKVSRSFLQLEGDDKAPDPNAETKAGDQNWVGAYLGNQGSLPPGFRVLSVEIDGKKVLVTYETITRNKTTKDYYTYIVWAPLGKLSCGEYTLELYDAAAKKVTATRKSRVVE